VVYNVLADLAKKDLISEKKKDGIAIFTPLHPEKLRQYVENRESELKKAQATLDANLAAIVSDFNLASGRPGVRFFEGTQAIKKILDDSLTSSETIYSYGNFSSLLHESELEAINKAYVKRRAERKISKKIITIDLPELVSRQNYYPDITEYRFIEHTRFFLPKTVMQIYDGKVSYLSFPERDLIGVIISDQNIYRMHRALFEALWESAKRGQ
jgi:sugar-specific transcriptional regulator TrmB